MKSNKINLDERLAFVRYWAKYIRENPNEKWSRQQVMLINSIMRSADKNPKTYLKMKKMISKK